MPELPEVETTVRDLNQKVLKRTFVDVWTDFEKIIKKPKSFQNFKKEIIGRKIKSIRRRGKNILFELSGGKTLLIHQKLTGHLLVGKWKLENRKWKSRNRGFLEEKVNSYIHLMFSLDSGKMIALSDLRKFAKIKLGNKKELEQLKEIKELGPEPLEKKFTFNNFKKRLENKKGKIKQVLIDQTVIAGIGNIYSDEILFKAKIHPFRDVAKLNTKELKKIYQAIKKILEKAIESRGESISDFRDIEGRRGFFDDYRKVYRREGQNCKICGTMIKRVKIGSRSAHFCPNCQRLKIEN